MKLFCILLLLLSLASPLVSSGQSQHELDSMEALIPKRNGKDKILLLNDLTYYYYQTDPEKAISFGEQSLKLALKRDDQKLLADTYNNLSMPYLTKAEHKKSLVLNYKSLFIRKQLKDTSGLISSYAKIGNSYFETTRYQEAQEAYDEAIKYAKQLKAEGILIQLYQNAATVLDASGYNKEALLMHQDIYKIAVRTGNKEAQIVSLGNIASSSRKLKKYKEAKKAYLKAISLIDGKQDPEKLSIIYQGLGVLERETGNTDLGLAYYIKALKLYRNLHSDIGEGTIMVNIGNCYLDLNQPDSARIYLLSGLNLLKSADSYKEIENAYRNLADLEKKGGDFRKSIEYLELQNKYKDSVTLHSGNEILSEMFAKYEVEKKERELALTKVKIAETKLKQVIWTGVSIGLVLIVFVIFLYFRHKRKLAKEELENKMKEEKFLREKQLNDQKVEISRELHDNIGSQITYMISSMDNLSYVLEDDKHNGTIKNISEFGRETMQELRSTIWAMNTTDGSVGLLFRKTEELRSKVPLTLRLLNNLEKEVPLKAIEMLNLYRIAQEFIQNTLKYADATEITISANETNKGMQLVLADNGKGFEQKTDLEGNGLRNMRYRCEHIGGAFEISSEPGKGTKAICCLRHLSY